MGLVTERLAILIDAHAGKAIAEFRSLGNATQGLQGSAATGTKAMDRLGLSGATAGALLKGGLAAGATAAVGALVGFGVSAVKSVQELDAAILQFQRVSGATTEESSALIAAFGDMAIPAETGSKAVFILGKNLATSKDKLAEFGIVAAKNRDGNTDMAATLMRVADAYVATADPTRRAALLTAAFGKSGKEMIPILEKGSKGIAAFYQGAKDTGQIRTAEQVQATEDLRLAMDELRDAGTEFSLMAGTVLVPVLTDVAQAATVAIGAVKSLAGVLSDVGKIEIGGVSVKGIVDKLTDVVVPGKLAIGTLMDLARQGDSTGKAFGALTGPLDEFAGRVAALGGPVSDSVEDLEALDKALFAAVDADRALADAHRGLSDAQADLNKLQREGAVDAEKVADAQRSLNDAIRSVGRAQREQAKAKAEYDAALSNANDLHGYDTAQKELTEAGDNLADANDNVASANERAADAAQELRAARAGDPDFQQKLADATQKVADATFDVSQRALASVTAHEAEAEALAANAGQAQALFDKYQALIKQNPLVAAALAGNLAALAPALAQKNPSLAGVTPTFKPGDPADILALLRGAPTPPLPSIPPLRLPGAPTQFGGVPLPGLTPAPVVTNNVTINTTTSEADARAIAREVIWNIG